MSDLFYQYDAKLLKFIRRGSSRLSRIVHLRHHFSPYVDTDYKLMLHRREPLVGQVAYQMLTIRAETLSMMEVVGKAPRWAPILMDMAQVKREG